MGDAAPDLIVCGTGSLEERCRQSIFMDHLPIEMTGLLSNMEVKKLIANSQALILPTQWYEGFPMTIVEAYSVGTPVICRRIGNAGSMVIERRTGWKFSDASGLAQCIREAEYTDLRAAVRSHYKAYYTAEANYARLMDIYCNI